MTKFLLFFTFLISVEAYSQGNIIVTKARWGEKDVTSEAEAFCNSKELCNYKISPRFIGKHEGLKKTFFIQWKCQTDAKVERIDVPEDATNKTITLDCRSDVELRPVGPSNTSNENVISVYDGGDCNPLFATTRVECENAKMWTPDTFTDPEQLETKEEFQIIFHSITAFNWSASSGPKPGSWNEKLLKDPTLISNNPKISASLITDKKYSTFIGHVGFILEVHPENIVTTNTSDSGSPSIKDYSEKSLNDLALYSNRYPIRSPSDIISKTTEGEFFSYNEVVLTGKPKKGPEVRPIGIILRCKTPRMTRLNRLSDFEFESFVKYSCTSNAHSVIAQLMNLRRIYPIFGFPLK